MGKRWAAFIRRRRVRSVPTSMTWCDLLGLAVGLFKRARCLERTVWFAIARSSNVKEDTNTAATNLGAPISDQIVNQRGMSDQVAV